jgi:Tfp pilus assembly pilus retraction ATPase PilT
MIRRMSEGYNIKDLLALAVSERAEKLILHTGQSPVVWVRGEACPIEGPAITPEHADSLLRSLAGTRYMREFYERGLVAFICTPADSAQFRVQAKLVGDEIQIDLEKVA